MVSRCHRVLYTGEVWVGFTVTMYVQDYIQPLLLATYLLCKVSSFLVSLGHGIT
jgi:hypothetical protein